MKISNRLIFLFIIFLINTPLYGQKVDRFWGFFEPGIENDIAKIQKYGVDLGKDPTIIMWYAAWGNNYYPDFPLLKCQNLWNAGYMPHIVWEPSMGVDQVLNGSLDNKLKKYGQDIATYGGPVVLRWGHEFNGDWYPWSISNGVLVPASKWIKAYKYVHDKITEAGGTNALWAWSPNVGNGAKNNQDVLEYWPGDNYVDWIAIDGYDWNTTWGGGSFSQIYGPIYTKMVNNFPGLPIMVGEFSTAKTGIAKAEWVTAFFNQWLNDFPQIKAINWFNIDKEADWRFNSDAKTLEAFRKGVQSPLISDDVTTLAGLLIGSQIYISGQSEVVGGEDTLLYHLSSFADGWLANWSSTGNSVLIGDITNDSILVNWGCDPDTIKCEIKNGNKSVLLSFHPTIKEFTINSQLFVAPNDTAILAYIERSSNSKYEWNLPDGVSITGKKDTNSLILNWSDKTDTLKLKMTNDCGSFYYSKILYVEGLYSYPDPSKAHEIPGIIESSDYDYGGQGIAYYDYDPVNLGSGRNEGVDTELNDNGETIGWTESGEWTNYSIDVLKPGRYFTELRVASQNGGGQLSILVNDSVRLSHIPINSTGSYSTFKSIYPGYIDFEKGDTLMKYLIEAKGFNIGRIIITEEDTIPPSIPSIASVYAGRTSISIKWNRTVDNHIMLGYDVLINDILMKSTTDTLAVISGLTSNTYYEVKIRAKDIQGNESTSGITNISTLITSINTTQLEGVEVYPNPMDNYFVLKVPSSLINEIFSIIDLRGIVISEQRITANETSIDISSFKPGIYLLKINRRSQLILKM
ncbi:MAG: T9SS type A sorting domain-containing protein [Prolixibacteraceae bacterium]